VRDATLARPCHDRRRAATVDGVKSVRGCHAVGWLPVVLILVGLIAVLLAPNFIDERHTERHIRSS
jgi:hypothetical protein